MALIVSRFDSSSSRPGDWDKSADMPDKPKGVTAALFY